MKTLIAAFKPISIWQAVVLVAVLAGSGVASYSLAGDSQSASALTLSEDQQLIAVQRGDLINSVSINGTVVFPNREQVSFAVAGTVGEVFVEEGQSAEVGQELARLDPVSIGELEEAVAEARVLLQNAEEALASALEPHTAGDIAAAKAEVASLKMDVDAAEEALAETLSYTELELRALEEQVASARVKVQQAEEALEAAKNPFTDRELVQQQEEVQQARVQIQTATEALDAARTPFSEQDIRSQEQVVAAAEKLFQDTGEVLEAVRTPYLSEEIASAQAAVDRAEETLANSQDALSVTEQTQARLVSQATDTVQESERAYLQTFVLGGSGRIEALETLTLAQESLDAARNREAIALTAARQSVTIAEDSLRSAREVLAIRQAGGDPIEIQLKEAEVAKAGADLRAAVDRLAEVNTGADPAEVALKEAQLATAQASLQGAEELLAEMQAGPGSSDVALKEAQLATAQAALGDAQEALSTLLSGPTPLEVADREARLELAVAGLAETEERLSELEQGADPAIVALREAELATARNRQVTALEDLEAATLRAPISGVVDVLRVEPGDQVAPNAPAFEIVDTTLAEVEGVVDEIDVLFVRPGASAEVTMDALQGQTLQGEVSWISTTATTASGVVSFPITILVEAPDDVELREGLSAAADVVLRESNNVLLIPAAAVGGSFLQPTVMVAFDGEIVELPVLIGDSDDFFVVVREGLSEGDMVVVESTGGGAGNFTFGPGGTAFRQIFGDGFRGGGQGGGGQGGGGQ